MNAPAVVLDQRQLDALKFIIAENKRIAQTVAHLIASHAGMLEVKNNFQLPIDIPEFDFGNALTIGRHFASELSFAHFKQLFPDVVDQVEAINKRRAVSPQPSGEMPAQVAA